MHHMTRWATLAVVVGVLILSAGCAADSGDKAGGPGEPVVLRLATVNGDLAFTPQVEALVAQVDELSDGGLRIEVVYEVGNFEPDSEKQVVDGVAAGTYDLGVVGTQVFDTLGVSSFRPLTAPMLVDSYALQSAVVRSETAEAMMQPLGELGVDGIALLAGTLRRPVAVEAPLGGPDDWAGVTFSTFDSELQFAAVRALGASPVAMVGDARDQALREGSLDGFESSVLAYQINAQQATAPYLTANVTLWPQTLAVVAGPGVEERLTGEQRDWLDQAADDAVRGTALADAEAKALDDVCVAGARAWLAPAEELAALREAFEPVYDDLRGDEATAEVLDEIEALKAATPADAAAEVPDDCAGVTPSEGEEGPGTAPRYLNGVYRYTLTHEDAEAVGQGDDPEYPMTQTWWLENGHWRGSGDSVGEYRVDGDRIVWQWTKPFESVFTFTFTRDDDGNLTLVPDGPMDPGDSFLMSGKPWTKIG
jgi:TRAP-type transport system periplasmic protein